MVSDVQILDPPARGDLTVIVDRHVTPTTKRRIR
jgi:hypothetical protein